MYNMYHNGSFERVGPEELSSLVPKEEKTDWH